MRHYSIVFFGWFLFAKSLFASAILDDQYAFQKLIVSVLSSTEEPVHSRQVELALIEQIQKRSRFEFLEEASRKFRKNLEGLSTQTRSEKLTENFEVLKPSLQSLKEEGAQAALLAELNRKEGLFDLTLTLVAIEPGEVIAQAVRKIEPPFSAERFNQNTVEAFQEINGKIPFDGSVLKRDGYLVILDGGAGVFTPGMRLPTFTLERAEGELTFNETGLILVQRAEENISFGKILVEKKPLEVSSGNKVRVINQLASNEIPELMQSVNDASRDPASQLTSDFEVSKGDIGRVGVNFAFDSVEFVNLVNGQSVDSDSAFFPGFQLEGELWFTNRWFIDSSLGISSSSIANTFDQPEKSQGAGLNSFRLQFGYRMNVLAPERGPVIYAKLGYGKQGYTLGVVEPVRFTSIAYGGMLLTGGVRIPIDESMNFIAEINTLTFPSIFETPYSSGVDQTNVNAWDFALRGTYSLSKELDIEGRVIFRNSGAEFLGESPRPDPISQFNQTSRVIQLGLSYYF